MTREAWTDERMDDLVKHMDNGFQLARDESRELREDMRDLRRDMKAGFEKVDAKFDAKFDSLGARFDSLQRLMIAALVTIVLAEVLGRF